MAQVQPASFPPLKDIPASLLLAQILRESFFVFSQKAFELAYLSRRLTERLLIRHFPSVPAPMQVAEQRDVAHNLPRLFIGFLAVPPSPAFQLALASIFSFAAVNGPRIRAGKHEVALHLFSCMQFFSLPRFPCFPPPILFPFSPPTSRHSITNKAYFEVLACRPRPRLATRSRYHGFLQPKHLKRNLLLRREHRDKGPICPLRQQRCTSLAMLPARELLPVVGRRERMLGSQL